MDECRKWVVLAFIRISGTFFLSLAPIFLVAAPLARPNCGSILAALQAFVISRPVFIPFRPPTSADMDRLFSYQGPTQEQVTFLRRLVVRYQNDPVVLAMAQVISENVRAKEDGGDTYFACQTRKTRTTLELKIPEVIANYRKLHYGEVSVTPNFFFGKFLASLFSSLAHHVATSPDGPPQTIRIVFEHTLNRSLEDMLIRMGFTIKRVGVLVFGFSGNEFQSGKDMVLEWHAPR